MKAWLVFFTLLILMPTAGFASAAPHGRGLVRDVSALRALKAMHQIHHRRYNASPLPAKGDLSPVASLCRNQGSCGSCWAYALTKSLQSEYMINGLPLPSLPDVAYLIGNCGGPVNELGCGGGDFPAGKNFLGGLGPWGGGVDPAGSRCKSLPAIMTAADFVMLGVGDAPPTDYEMVEAMNAKHVLTIDVAAGGGWGNYPRGAATVAGLPVWNRSTSSNIDHMINRLGWTCTSVASDGSCAFDSNGNSPGIVYLDMNNWDEDWGVKAPNGHGGYIYETRLANRAGETAAYFTVTVPTPPVPPVPPTPPAPPDPPGPGPAPQPAGIPLWALIAAGVGILISVVIALLKKPTPAT